MKKLWEFDDLEQNNIIPMMLDHHGEVVNKFSSPYSWIYTIKEKFGSNYLIAKAPKIDNGMNAEEVRGRILKMLTEINTINRICLHSFIHRFGKIELVFGVPFLISTKRHMTLRDVMEEGPVDIVDVLTISIQLARSIEYIQSRGFICHQDLKAENIFIDSIQKKFATKISFPYKYQAYLADFDLVNTAILFNQPYGSRPYQAPEQYVKDGKVKFDKIDVFAIGVNMIEMLTGGVHPIGVRTTDAWPVSAIGSKWNREEPWKKWARAPQICKDLNLDFKSSLISSIIDFFEPNYFDRPNISEVKERLLSLLMQHDENAYRSLSMYIAEADSAEMVNNENGWPYMEELVTKINTFYESEN